MQERYCIQKDIIAPLEQCLAGDIPEKEIDWSGWKYAIYELRKKDFYGVRDVLVPYYHDFFMADKRFFRNGNTDVQLKNALLATIEKEGNYAGRLFKQLDLVKAAENWADRLIVNNHEPTYFFMLLNVIIQRDYNPDWNSIYNALKEKLIKARHYGNFKKHELYCILMGLTMIELSSLPKKRKNELFSLMRYNWAFMRYMYSAMIQYIVGLKVDNFASLAFTACNLKSAYPHMHLLYKAFNTNFDRLCPEGLIDMRSGNSVRQQALVHKAKMEDIIKSTPPSNELEELCSILFPKIMSDVLKQARPRTYEELEYAIDDITDQYNKVLAQLTKVVKDVDNDIITGKDLIDAFLRFPVDLALSFFGSMSTLLALNPTWQKYAPMIQQSILEKQEEEMREKQVKEKKQQEEHELIKELARRPTYNYEAGAIHEDHRNQVMLETNQNSNLLKLTGNE